MTDSKQHVEDMIAKAAKAAEPHHAMNFAQAALNAAHALQTLATTAAALSRA